MGPLCWNAPVNVVLCSLESVEEAVSFRRVDNMPTPLNKYMGGAVRSLDRSPRPKGRTSRGGCKHDVQETANIRTTQDTSIHNLDRQRNHTIGPFVSDPTFPALESRAHTSLPHLANKIGTHMRQHHRGGRLLRGLKLCRPYDT